MISNMEHYFHSLSLGLQSDFLPKSNSIESRKKSNVTVDKFDKKYLIKINLNYILDFLQFASYELILCHIVIKENK